MSEEEPLVLTDDLTVFKENRDQIINADDEILLMSNEEIISLTAQLEMEIKDMRIDIKRIVLENSAKRLKINKNKKEINKLKRKPYMVSSIMELFDVDQLDTEEDGAVASLNSQKTRKYAVIKTPTKKVYFVPVIGLVDPDQLKPGDLVGVNKKSFLILEKLPDIYDDRIKRIEVDEKPSVQYADIGGLDKQIQELIEAVVLPITHKEEFLKLGIQPSKGVLMYGPPGTGKTLLAQACAAQTKSTFLKLSGTLLVNRYTGEGTKSVQNVFALAKEKAPAIIFIDELDAIGRKRFNSKKRSDREVQRTMLELLNQLDGFNSTYDIKVIAATNRVDILDPALLRSGRFDRKIELPHPNEEARARIMQIHSRKMKTLDINFEELSRSTDGFNGAQCKAVCVEAGMIALKRDASAITHEDYMDAIMEVQAKKKSILNYIV
ncbi:26S proteasome regulatory subunit 6A-B-like [Aphis gossypii]|uniref:26S proteasome regulatory subunit 6A-B-like n=1 Tax=Aphis gossypii TaxID=80765 RepID=UPI0021595676|nr:26S proteasome regulatory subunit 6A-B-like [Aphis gossypii]